MPNPIDQISSILGAPEGWLRDQPLNPLFKDALERDFECCKPTDHRAEAEQAAANGKYEIATYHALMLIAGRL